MEYFEKAHVTRTNLSNRDCKSQEGNKRLLKQMLCGYRKSDNELIKKSEDCKNDLEDTMSVSGFSDLNLTGSSNEADSTHATLHSDEDDLSITDFKDTITTEISDEVSTSTTTNSNITLSNNDEDIQSLSVLNVSDINDSDSDMLSLIESIENTTTDSEASKPFDSDRALATKILANLRKSPMKKDTIKDKSTHSVKLDTIISANNNSVDSYVSENNSNYNVIASESGTDESLPFESVTAADMPNSSFSEVLGDYRHSTVKNLPPHNVFDFSIEYPSSENSDAVEDGDDFISEMEVDSQSVSDVASTQETHNNHSTIVQDSMAQSEELFDKESSIESLKPLVTNLKILNKKSCSIILMKHPAKLFIYGKVRMKVLGGKVDIFGYCPKTNICDIYAPYYSCAQCVITVENDNIYYGLFSKLTSAGLSVSEAEEIVTTINSNDAVISLHQLKDKKIDYVENTFKVTDLFNKPTKNIENYFNETKDIVQCSLYTNKPMKCFESSFSWKQPIECGLNNTLSKGIICGGKGVGKSTFVRYYVNKMLERGPILLVDVDPGQCEFTVAGNLSATVVTEPLLGPSFTHLKTPDLMLNIGLINVMDSPTRYAEAVKNLIKHCQMNVPFSNLPWIVNTMGMCHSLGLKFITLIVLLTKPTFLLQVDSRNSKKRFDCHLNQSTIRDIYNAYQKDRLFKGLTYPEDFDYSFFISDHSENSVKGSSLVPRDERYLNFLAYFGELMNKHRVGKLLEVIPYEVNLSDVNIAVTMKIKKDAITKVINGKIIALCQENCDKAGDVFMLTDKPLLCHGHGIVRCVDYAARKLYITTPLPINKLKNVNTLVYADWVPELRGSECELAIGTMIPYRTAAAYQHRQFMFSPKRRFNPLQLLKMSRSPK